jgi:cell division septation protein DedD
VVRAPDAPPAEPVRLADPTEVKRPAPQARQKAAANGWSVQLGSFASEANAQKLVRELRARGFTVFMVSGGTGKATRHRVLVGPWSDHEAALEAAAKLKAQGHSVSVLSPSA